MLKKIFGVLFIIILIFLMPSSSNNSIYNQFSNDVFGYPFVFFSLNSSSNETNFSLLGLVGNICVYAVVAFALIKGTLHLKAYGRSERKLEITS